MRSFALMLLALCSCAGPQTVRVGEVDRRYLMHVPRNVREPAPLVILLHGGGRTSQELRDNTGFNAEADARGWIAVYPSSHGERWNDGRGAAAIGEETSRVDDVGFIRAVVEDVGRRHTIDRTRIFVTGFSSGAMLAIRLVCETNDIFAAVAPISGSTPELLAETCSKTRPISMLLIQGTEDTFIPFQGGAARKGRVLGAEKTVAEWRALAACNGEPEVQELDAVPTDRTRARRESWSCANGVRVTLVTITGGGHTWPGGPDRGPEYGVTSRELSANKEIADFFDGAVK